MIIFEQALVQLGLMPIICHKNIYNMTVNYNSWSGSTIRDLEGPGEGRDVHAGGLVTFGA